MNEVEIKEDVVHSFGSMEVGEFGIVTNRQDEVVMKTNVGLLNVHSGLMILQSGELVIRIHKEMQVTRE